MFKKRNIERKVDVSKDIEEIVVHEHQDDNQQQDNPTTVPKSILTKKINKFSNQPKKQQPEQDNAAKRPPIVKYGLIDKEQVNSKYHANLQNEDQKQPEKHSIVNFYVKKKMEEMAGSKDEVKEKEKDANAEEIIKMQKKYLQFGEEKLAEYDIAEILKKLENMATNSIKSETENRRSYLKNLLQNQHERMEYASKKQLKTLKQQKERMQQEFRNKYNDSGRRGFVEKMKYEAMLKK